MCAKKINKEEKRKRIALSCIDLLVDMGIKKLTVQEVAQNANIGKGTVYEYFANKDDIVFEIISQYINKYHSTFLEKIKDIKTTKKKLYYFFEFVLDDSLENKKHFNCFKEYLSIVLADDKLSMKIFNKKTNDFLKEKLKFIINEGIQKKELKPEALDLCEGLFIFEKGLTLLKMIENENNAKADFEKFINVIFSLIEIKKEENV